MWKILFLLLLAFFFYAWYMRMRLKEEAFSLATIAVQQHNYQLLDDAVGLSKTRILRSGWHFALIHIFEFHYADENDRRLIGQVVRHGKVWLNIKFDVPASPKLAENKENIIQFPKE